MQGMSEAQFEEMLRGKGGTDFILKDDRMKQMFLPVIRADMLLEASYQTNNSQLNCPVTVFRGAACPLIRREDTESWLELSRCRTNSSLIELSTELKPNPQQPWLSDW